MFRKGEPSEETVISKRCQGGNNRWHLKGTASFMLQSLIHSPAEIRLEPSKRTSYSTVLHPVEVLNAPLHLAMDTVSQKPLVDKLWLQLTMFCYIITEMGKEFHPRMLIAFKLHGILLLSSVWLDLIQCMRPDGAFTGIKPEYPGHHLEPAVSSACIWHAWNTPNQANLLKPCLILDQD